MFFLILPDDLSYFKEREVIFLEGEQAKADKKLATSNTFPQITVEAMGKTSKSGSNSAFDSYAYGFSGRQLIFDSFKTSSQDVGF